MIFKTYEEAIEYLLNKCKTCSSNGDTCFQDKSSFKKLNLETMKAELNKIGYDISEPKDDPFSNGWAPHILDEKFSIFKIQ